MIKIETTNISQKDVTAFIFSDTSDHYFDKAKRKLESCDHHEIFIAPCEKVLGSQLESRWKKNWKKKSTVYGPSLSQQFSHQSLSSFWHHLFLCSGLLVHTLTKFYVPFPFSDSSNSASRILGMNTVKIW